MKTQQSNTQRKLHTPLVLSCNLSGERLTALEAVASSLQISVKSVLPAELSRTAGELCGLGAGGSAPSALLQPFREEMLLMAFFPDGLIDRFLAALRAAGLGGILKCVLTSVNAAWTLLALHQELCREREAFRKPKP